MACMPSQLVYLALLVVISPASAGWRTFFKLPFFFESCKPVQPSKNVDLQAYASKPWYIMAQMDTLAGNPQNRYRFCVRAEYTIKDTNNVAVYNFANEGAVNGKVHEANLCAYVANPGSEPGALSVAPCYLPEVLGGPYWILAYSEEEGYALVSGGAPYIPTHDDLCRTGNGVNNSGLWIFTRSNIRDEALVHKVKRIARDLGFDIDVLLDVVQDGCTYQPNAAAEGTNPSLRGGNNENDSTVQS